MALPRIVNVESTEAQKSFVEVGFGWSLISEVAVGDPRLKGRYTIAPLAPALDRELVIAWRRDRVENPSVAAARERFSDYASI